MLSDTQIKKYIKKGKITIDPYDEKNVHPSTYKLSLGNTLLIPEKDQLIDLTKPQNMPHYDSLDISKESHILEPHDFVLGQTTEFVGSDTDVGIILDGRSTLARLGVTVHQSALLISPGQDPHVIVLEIFNASNFRIKLAAGIKIAEVMFFKMDEATSVPYKSRNRYNGQSITTGARIV